MNTDWKTGRIGDLCALRQEQRYPVKDEQTPYLSLEHVETGAFSAKRFGTAGEMLSSQNRFSAGDVLYGKLRPYLDKAVLADCEGACTTELLVLKPNPNVDSLYLLAALHTQDFIQHAIQTTHGVNHPRTSWAAIREFELLIAPPSEQHRIAAVLTKQQRAVELEAAQERAARELKQAVMRHLFTRGLRGESLRDSPIGPLPESWEDRELGELTEFLQYGTSAKCDSARIGVPVLRIPNVVGGIISTEDLKFAELPEKIVESLRLERGDILFVRTNGQQKYIGRCAVYKGEPAEPCLFASYLIRARLQATRAIPEFIQFYTETETGRSFLSGRSSSAADGKFNLNTKAIESVLVPLPPPAEQREIAAILAAIDQKAALHAARRRARQDLFRSTLHALMTARLRVPEDWSHFVDATKKLAPASSS